MKTEDGTKTKIYEGPATLTQGGTTTEVSATLYSEAERIWLNDHSPPIDGLKTLSGQITCLDGLLLFGESTLTLANGGVGKILLVAVEFVDGTALGDVYRRHLITSVYSFVVSGGLS